MGIKLWYSLEIPERGVSPKQSCPVIIRLLGIRLDGRMLKAALRSPCLGFNFNVWKQSQNGVSNLKWAGLIGGALMVGVLVGAFHGRSRFCAKWNLLRW